MWVSGGDEAAASSKPRNSKATPVAPLPPNFLRPQEPAREHTLSLSSFVKAAPRHGGGSKAQAASRALEPLLWFSTERLGGTTQTASANPEVTNAGWEQEKLQCRAA